MTNAIFSNSQIANTTMDDDCTQSAREFITNLYIIDRNGTYHAYGGDGINASVVSLEWTDVASPNNGFYLGTFSTNELRVKLTFPNATSGFPVADFGNSIVGCQIYASVESHRGLRAYDPVCPLGAFVITDVTVSNDGRDYDITAYATVDHMSDEFNISDLTVTYPLTAWSLYNAICTYLGVGVSANYPSATDITILSSLTLASTADDVSNLPRGTYTDYLGWIAGYVGCNVRFDRVVSQNPIYQTLKMVSYTNASFTIERDVQHLDGVNKKYGGAVMYQDMVSGSSANPIYRDSGLWQGANAIIVNCPFMTQSRLDDIANDILGGSLYGITIVPCDVTWRGNPRVDACDIVQVENEDGTTFDMYIMEHTVSITGGLRDTSHAYASTEEATSLYENGDVPLTTRGGDITGTLTIDGVPVLTEKRHYLKTYTDVTQLGLTYGSATILGAIDNMPIGSMLMTTGDGFDPNETPGAFGQIRICKNTIYDVSIEFIFDDVTQYGMYVMGVDVNGEPDGTWTKLITENDFYYKPGDTVALSQVICAGYLTSSSKSFSFYIPLPKPAVTSLINTAKVNVSITNGSVRHANGGYLIQGADFSSGYTLDARVRLGGITVAVTSTTAWSATTNTPVAVQIASGTLTFTS